MVTTEVAACGEEAAGDDRAALLQRIERLVDENQRLKARLIELGEDPMMLTRV